MMTIAANSYSTFQDVLGKQILQSAEARMNNNVISEEPGNRLHNVAVRGV